MKYWHDAIIIGSGIGGLAGAAYLSKKGYRVKVFERLNAAGGYINTFKRKNYYFENSTHFMALDPSVLKMLGLKNIDLLKVRESIEVFFMEGNAINKRVFLESGRKELIKTLANSFDIEETEVVKIFRIFRKIGRDIKRLHRVLIRAPFANLYDMITAMLYIIKNKNSFFQKLGKYSYKHIDKAMDKSFHDFLKFVDDPHLKSIFKFISSACFILPSTDYFGTVGVYLNWAYLISPSIWIKGGTKNIINGLIDIITGNEGSVEYNSPVKEIIIEDNKAFGVRLENSDELYANYIISNVNASMLYNDLIKDKETYSPELKDKLDNYSPSSSVFQIYLGLPFLLKDYGYTAGSNAFYNEIDTDRLFEKKTDLNDPDFFVLTNYSAIDPSYSEKGKSSIVITTKSDYNDWSSLDRLSYNNMKKKFEKIIINKVMGLTGLPLDKAEVVFSATPVTMKRYTGNVNGGIMGLEPSINSGDRFGSRSQIKNLFIAGADSSIGGGFNGSIYSGIISAKQIIMPFLNF